MLSEHDAPAASVPGHASVTVKSPETASVSARELVPVFCTISVCDVAETAVTATGVANVTLLADTLRLGLAAAPVIAVSGSVSPVSRTAVPSSRFSTSAS
jgi:hypothetical protein